jgi:glutamyl-tRNA reductase
MVASSLDSMVVGEVQIIGQVKESYRLACSVKSPGKVLNHLFHCAFATAKKVYTTTAISNGRVSVAGVAIELAMQLFADISSAKIVVIGAGEMGELLVKHLLHVKSRNITIINRSYENGLKVASQYGVEAGKWEEIDEQLTDADIVIASAASQDYLFTKDSFKKIMNRRHKTALLIIDIAVPRNFEPAINELEDVYLYSIDELSEVAEQNLKNREDDIAKGTQIVYENAADFMNWFKARDIGPLIGRMKEKFAQVGRDELEKFFIGTREDASSKKTMEVMVNRIVSKLLHCVIENINTVAKEQGPVKAAKLIERIVQQADEICAEQSENPTKSKEL